MNTDGVAKGCPGLGGAGGIFRISNGFSVGAFAIPLGSCFAFDAELHDVMVAVRFAVRYNFSPLWIESDSTTIIKLIHSQSGVSEWCCRLASS